jgi:uncharacterized protein (TIGR02270 family)
MDSPIPPSPRPSDAGFLPDLVEEHADAAGFLRSLRSRLVRSRVVGLADLLRFDDRLDAHLDALVLAAGDERARAAAYARASGPFVSTVLALCSRRAGSVEDEILRAAGDARRAKEVVAAIGWAPAPAALAVLGEIAARQPAARAALLAAQRTHAAPAGRGDPLVEGLRDEDPVIRAAALRAAGELGRRDLAPLVARGRDDGSESCRAWAAWSGAALGDAAAARVLVKIAASGEHALGGRTLDLAVRVTEPDQAEALVRGAFARGQAREAIDAAAAWGDARAVPWLLGLTGEPAVARLAGWAITTLTGIDPVAEKLTAPPPAGFSAGPTDSPFEHEVHMDPDARLPWPDPTKLLARWTDAGERSPAGARLLGGRPRDAEVLAAALCDGPQRARALAALDLHLLSAGGEPLFEVRAPAFRQIRRASPLRTGSHVGAR